VAKQLRDLTLNPKPDYSVDGKQYSWSAHYRTLLEMQKTLRQARQMEDGAFEVRSRGTV